MQRSTFLPIQPAATLILSVDWGLGCIAFLERCSFLNRNSCARRMSQRACYIGGQRQTQSDTYIVGISPAPYGFNRQCVIIGCRAGDSFPISKANLYGTAAKLPVGSGTSSR